MIYSYDDDRNRSDQHAIFYCRSENVDLSVYFWNMSKSEREEVRVIHLPCLDVPYHPFSLYSFKMIKLKNFVLGMD